MYAIKLQLRSIVKHMINEQYFLFSSEPSWATPCFWQPNNLYTSPLCTRSSGVAHLDALNAEWTFYFFIVGWHIAQGPVRCENVRSLGVGWLGNIHRPCSATNLFAAADGWGVTKLGWVLFTHSYTLIGHSHRTRETSTRWTSSWTCGLNPCGKLSTWVSTCLTRPVSFPRTNKKRWKENI